MAAKTKRLKGLSIEYNDKVKRPLLISTIRGTITLPIRQAAALRDFLNQQDDLPEKKHKYIAPCHWMNPINECLAGLPGPCIFNKWHTCPYGRKWKGEK